jgi:CTP:molybdopterin cytidylyltransferase MocA
MASIAVAVLAAVILAAGDSTRMGRPKALLADPGGRPFVARLVRTFAAAGVDRIVVVTGSLHDRIQAALDDDLPPVHAVCVRNPDPARGQLSSLWVGLDAADRPGIDGVLVIPVDIPMVDPATVRSVIDGWVQHRAPIVRPVVGDAHGHPVLFDRALFDDLRRAPVDRGARSVVHANADRLLNVPVDDAGCVADIDTPADYEKVTRGPQAR